MPATSAISVFVAFVAAVQLLIPAAPAFAGKKAASAAGKQRGGSTVGLGRGNSELPPGVAEMREAILAAARSGNLDELLIPIQWNELPPDFGALSVRKTIAAWKKQSPDKSGREWLARLINLLESPYAVLRQGPDIENNKVYVWPYFAEVTLDSLKPSLQVELLRLVPAVEAQRMKAGGGYDGWGLVIGADGTWHAFKRVTPLAKRAKP